MTEPPQARPPLPAPTLPQQPGSDRDSWSRRSASALGADTARVAAAGRLLPGPGGNPALDRLSELAARLLCAGSAQVSLLTTEQHVAGGSGLGDGAEVAATSPLVDSLCAVTADSAAPLVVGNALTDPRVAHLSPVTSGAVGSFVGVPLSATDGAVVGALCVFDPTARSWSVQDVSLLAQLSTSVMAELELSALSAEYEFSRLRWDVAIDAAGIGSFDWNLRTDRVDWDERLQDLFGYAPGEYVPHIAEAFSRIHPDDRAAVDAAIEAAVSSCGDYRAEFRVVLPSGQPRWVAARGRAYAGDDGTAAQLVGTAHDVTEVRTARDQAAHMLSTMATGFLSVDRDWRVTYLNDAAERVVGMTAQELVGRNLWEAFPGLEDIGFGQTYHRAVETGEPLDAVGYYAHLDGWFEARAVPGPEGLALYFVDITARHADQERAEGAAARLRLLATVSDELAATLDAKAAVARLAQLVVPDLCDCCIVSLDEGDGVRDVGWWHDDPALRPATERYAATRLGALADGSYLGRALATGQPELVPEDATARICDVLVPGEAREVLAQIAPESAAMLPMLARGRTVGALTLLRSADRPRLADGDLAVAQEVAARAGLALDNALLYARQRSLAETLQRSMLTEPPEPDHCEIVVRYVPAAEAASVGGDWFDSFLQSDGATILVIGDVVGHDTEAAGAMGQVRGLLRGIAWYSGGGPAEVLTGLDAAMQGLQVGTTASAVVARLEQTSQELDEGARRLRWSNAGHPPPMVVQADGHVAQLATAEADLLLGIDPTTSRREATTLLHEGATVLLYTDGLVERRGQSLDEGLTVLARTLSDLAPLPLPDLCDELLVRMLPERAEDDVALVAVRLHPEDRPRPPEAGPVRVPPVVATSS